MPDITMCNNESCPMKLKCYRHEAKPIFPYQSWCTFQFNSENKTCDDFKLIKDSK